MIWAAVLAGSIGCYLLKLAGLSVPPKVLESKVAQRIAAALPVALLGSLIVIQTFSTGHQLTVDARAAGVAAALVAVLLRAPFLVVVGVAAATAAVLRLLT